MTKGGHNNRELTEREKLEADLRGAKAYQRWHDRNVRDHEQALTKATAAMVTAYTEAARAGQAVDAAEAALAAYDAAENARRQANAVPVHAVGEGETK